MMSFNFCIFRASMACSGSVSTLIEMIVSNADYFFPEGNIDIFNSLGWSSFIFSICIFANSTSYNALWFSWQGVYWIVKATNIVCKIFPKSKNLNFLLILYLNNGISLIHYMMANLYI